MARARRESYPLAMKTRRAEEAIRDLLSQADVIVGGRRPWDVRVLNPDFYERALEGGSLAVGDAYVDGWWEADRLDQMFHRVFLADLHQRPSIGMRGKLEAMRLRFGRAGERRAVEEPPAYERLGGDVFAAMLGERMSLTCAYWGEATTLDEAQEAQLDLVCRKLELQPGMTVLEIGCGWGAFAKYAAERHGVGVLGVDSDEARVETGRRLCRGLPVELLVQDHKEVQGRFDRVVSLGILERLGPRGYRPYMESASRRLKDDGIGLIHTIGRNATEPRGDPWFDRHIRPDGAAPSIQQLSAAMEGLFVLEDCHNLGPQYDPTLLAWQANLELAWPALRDKYGERVFRTMKYHLLSSAGSFRSRRSQVFQIVMTKAGRRQPHCRVDAGTWLDLRPLIDSKGG